MAAKFVIPSIFTAVDKMTAPLQRMQAGVSRFAATASVQMARGERSFRGISSAAKSAYDKISPFKRLGFLGLSLGLAGVTTVLGKFVSEAAKIEDATAAFTPLLGGVENARRLVTDLNKAAAETPFQFGALQQASQLMIGFGVATQANVIDKLKMVGDIAQGNEQKLQGIALAYSQIGAAGKANMQDVNQLINNGVPILGELAKMWGVNVGQARKMVEQGKGTSAEIEKAFKRMTSEGGMFFNGMAIASQTFSGRLSTLKDNVNLAFAEIGMAAMPVIKEFTDLTIQVTERVRAWAGANKELIQQKVAEWGEKARKVIGFLADNFDTITTLVKWYVFALVGLRAITILSTGAMYAHQLGLFLFSKQARLATIAQWKLNMAFLANPLTWVAIIIMVVVAAIVVMMTKVKGWGEQWEEVMTWMRNVFKLFKLHLLLQFQLLYHGFMTMVDSIVLAWKWMQNKLGLLSDEQYARDKARIEEEKRLRISAIKETAKEYAATMGKVLSGPKFVLRWEGSRADYMANYEQNNTPFPARTFSGGIEAINGRAEQQQAASSKTTEETLNKIMIELGGAPPGTKVKDNPGNVPIKMSSTTGQFGG